MTASLKASRRQTVADSVTDNLPLTNRQEARLKELKERHRVRHDRPDSVIDRDGMALRITPAPGEDKDVYAAGLYDALGTTSSAFANDTLAKIIRIIAPDGNVKAEQYNAAIAIMASVEPENELEATLASQMVAANDCAMRCMNAMVLSDHLDHRRMHGDLANKFMRTFTAQIDALSRLRRGGEQIVKHVYVGEGGQAVFAKGIYHERGANYETGGQGHASTHQCSALPGPDAARDGVPVPGNAEREVSHARRNEHRGAEG